MKKALSFIGDVLFNLMRIAFIGLVLWGFLGLHKDEPVNSGDYHYGEDYSDYYR